MHHDYKLVSGGRVLDLDGDLDQPAVADILIEEGRILAVGPEATQRAAQIGTITRLDATGQLIIPGLVNAHYHSHDTLLRGLLEQMPMDIWSLYSNPGRFSRMEDRDMHLRTLVGAAECLGKGITTVQDMVTIVGADAAHVSQVESAYARSGIRVVLGIQVANVDSLKSIAFWNELPVDVQASLPKGSDPAALQDLLETLLSRGGTQRLTFGLAPSAPQRCSDDVMRWVADMAHRHGAQVFTHVYEARSQAVLARQAEQGSFIMRLDRFGLLGPHLTIAHGVWIDEAELAQFGAAEANLAFNPVSNMKLLNGFAPIVRYAKHGAGIAVGCDNCSGNDCQNLFESMKLFALFWGLQTTAGEKGAARRAFEAATLGGARALGLGGEIGALRPGYRADMVMIDLSAANYRPLNSAIRQLVYGESGSGITCVMVEGKVVVANGQYLPVPGAELKAATEDWKARTQDERDRVYANNAKLLPHLLQAHMKAQDVPLPIDRFSMC